MRGRGEIAGRGAALAAQGGAGARFAPEMTVIASEAFSSRESGRKQSRATHTAPSALDCFVAWLLAMTRLACSLRSNGIHEASTKERVSHGSTATGISA